jgi:hypothetical protein
LIVAAVLALFGLGTVACLALAGNEIAKEIDRSMGDAASADYDVNIDTCETDTFAGARATGSITNTSDKNQGFQINLRFETEDGVLIAEQPHFTDTINVGQSQPWNITTFQDVPEGASLTCEVSSVRYTIFDDETRNN